MSHVRFLGDLYTEKQFGATSFGPRFPAFQNGYAMGATNPKDLDQVIQPSEWIAQPFTRDQALATYSSILHFLAAREKLAFLASLGSRVAKNVALYNAVSSTKDGRGLLEAANAAGKSLSAYGSPNALKSAAMGAQAFETTILPRLGLSVRGKMPLFRDGEIQTISVFGPTRSNLSTYDFGDLSTSSVEENLRALELAANDVKARFQLGLAFPVLLGVWFAFILGVSTVFVGIVREFKPEMPPLLKDPTVRSFLERMSPDEAAKFIKDATVAQNFMGDVKMSLQWGAVFLGTAGILGLIGWMIWKD